MNKSKRRRQLKQDQHTLLKGVNLGSTQAEPTEAMARQLFSMLEQSKRDGKIDAPVKFLQDKCKLNEPWRPHACLQEGLLALLLRLGERNCSGGTFYIQACEAYGQSNY